MKRYSLKKHGNKFISRHFRVRDFALDDTDVVYIDMKLVNHLERIRRHFKKPLTIVKYDSSGGVEIKIDGVTQAELLRYARKIEKG